MHGNFAIWAHRL